MNHASCINASQLSLKANTQTTALIRASQISSAHCLLPAALHHPTPVCWAPSDLPSDQSYQQQYQKNNKKQLMTSLCTPFLSNFSTTNVFLLLATSLAGLLTFLNHPQKSSIPEPSRMPACFTAQHRTLRPVKSGCLHDCQGETVASTAIGGSLSHIMSNRSSDFKSEREEAGLVHSLELMDEAFDESFEVQTVVSCMMSDRDDPNSTENSFGWEDQLSDLEDL